MNNKRKVIAASVALSDDEKRRIEKEAITAFLTSRRTAVLESVNSIKDAAGIDIKEWDNNMMKYYKWTASVIDWLIRTVNQSKSKYNGNRS